MSDFPPEIPSDFKPRRGFLMTSGILFGLFGLMLCGIAVLSVFQYIMMKSLTTLSPDAAAEIGGMTGMVGIASIINVVFYGSVGVLMLVVGYGCMFLKRWSRPFALTLSWGWLYTGLIMVFSMVTMMGAMQKMMGQAMEEAAATSGGTAPAMDGFFAVFMVIYIAFIFAFMVMVPGLILWLNWGQDVRQTLESCDPKPRWTDRQPVPVMGMAITSAFFGLAALPGILMMNQPWMSQFFPGDTIRYAFFLVPFGWLFVAWGSYRRQIGAWAVALLLLLGLGGMGIYSMQNVDWALMYEQMGMPQSEIEKMTPMIDQIMDPKKMTVLMALTMLPMVGFLIWVGRYFWGQPESGGGEGRLVAGA